MLTAKTAGSSSSNSEKEPRHHIDDNKRCTNCIKPSKDLKKCGQCRMVQYCSRECQKAVWPMHKASCKLAVMGRPDPEDEVAAELTYELNKWLKYWRQRTMMIGMDAMDLGNYPNRLATHVWVVFLKQNFDSELQAYCMTCLKAVIWTREQVAQNMRIQDPENAEFAQTWYEDNRGPHVLSTAIFLESHTRFLYGGFRDIASTWGARNSKESRRLAHKAIVDTMGTFNDAPTAEMLAEWASDEKDPYLASKMKAMLKTLK